MCECDLRALNVRLIKAKFAQVDQFIFCHLDLFTIWKIVVICVTDILTIESENSES